MAKPLTPHRIKVRQFKKQAGHKVRSHTRKSPNTTTHASSKNVKLSPLIDPADAKAIQSLLIQDKLDLSRAKFT